MIQTNQDNLETFSPLQLEADAPLKKWSELLKGSVKLTWSKKWRFIYLNFIPRLLSIMPLIIILLLYIIFNLIARFSNSQSIFFNIINIVLGLLGMVALLGPIIYGFVWSQAAYVYYLQTNTISKKEILKRTISQVWGLFWVTLLKGLIILAGFILFIVPGIIWSIKYGFAPLAFLMEGHKGMDALRRSAELSKGYRWPIFKRVIIFSYVQLAVQVVFALVFILFNLLGSLGTTFTILSLVLYLLAVLINIFIGFLIEPFGFVYDYDIFNNLADNKKADNAAQEKYGFKQKLWTLVLMVLIPLIVLGFGLINYFLPLDNLFIKNLNRILPQNWQITESKINQEGTFFGAVAEAEKKSRDTQRISAVKQIQVALELYYTENEVYPVALTAVALGKGDFACLDMAKGFGAVGDCSESIFSEVPANPEPGGSDFIYQSDGTSYRLTCELEVGISDFPAGLNSFSSAEFAAELEQLEQTAEANDDALLDSDNDGLTDTAENDIWQTNPANPDSDGDGYQDGEEVNNGFNPLGSGKLE